MKDKVFFDTNILIYAFTKSEKPKKSTAKDLLYDNDVDIVISTQVINELINVLIRKNLMEVQEIPPFLSHLLDYLTPVTIEQKTIREALYLHIKYKYAYYDCLILSSALEKDCKILYSEDMQHKQRIKDKLNIINPF